MLSRVMGFLFVLIAFVGCDSTCTTTIPQLSTTYVVVGEQRQSASNGDVRYELLSTAQSKLWNYTPYNQNVMYFAPPGRFAIGDTVQFTTCCTAKSPCRP